MIRSWTIDHIISFNLMNKLVNYSNLNKVVIYMLKYVHDIRSKSIDGNMLGQPTKHQEL